MNKAYLILKNATLQQALAQLNATSSIGLVVVDDKDYLQGSITDGDIRRALLAGNSIESQVSSAMCEAPLFCFNHIDPTVIEKAKTKIAYIIPIIDKDKKVLDLYFLDNKGSTTIPVVLMAGGMGKRLGDITKDCPKPMVKIGDFPLLEIIIKNFVNQGFRKFYLAVNYKSEIIENYFGNGEKFFCEIQYLKEEVRSGTAGALSLLPPDLTSPVLVMNGDLLTQIDFLSLQKFHEEHSSPITVGIRKYDFQVPYGVINVKDGTISSFDEKPTQSFFVNAGVYIIDSIVYRKVPANSYYDMSQLLTDSIASHTTANCYPVIEQWIDVGSPADLHIARIDSNSSPGAKST